MPKSLFIFWARCKRIRLLRTTRAKPGVPVGLTRPDQRAAVSCGVAVCGGDCCCEPDLAAASSGADSAGAGCGVVLRGGEPRRTRATGCVAAVGRVVADAGRVVRGDGAATRARTRAGRTLRWLVAHCGRDRGGRGAGAHRAGAECGRGLRHCAVAADRRARGDRGGGHRSERCAGCR